MCSIGFNIGRQLDELFFLATRHLCHIIVLLFMLLANKLMMMMMGPRLVQCKAYALFSSRQYSIIVINCIVRSIIIIYLLCLTKFDFENLENLYFTINGSTIME